MGSVMHDFIELDDRASRMTLQVADHQPQLDVRLWTLTKDTVTDEPLGPGGIESKVSVLKASPETSRPGSSTLTLFSLCGDPFRGHHGLLARAVGFENEIIREIAPLEDFLGLSTRHHSLFQTLRGYQHYFTDYDPSQQHRQAITILCRIGRNHHAFLLALRIHLPSMSAVALLTAKHPSDLNYVRTHITSDENIELLRASPLGLLAIILDQRSALWDEWVSEVWYTSSKIEGFFKLKPDGWLAVAPEPQEMEELKDVGKALAKMRKHYVEACHGVMVVEAGLRLAHFCRDIVSIVHGDEQGILGTAGLNPCGRERLVERLREPLGKFESVIGRFQELSKRHQGHVMQIDSQIAQKESKISRAVAEVTLDVARVTASDSRTMKTISFMEMIFLPAIFISTLWGAMGIIELDDTTNRAAFAGAIIGLSGIVLSCWVIFMRFSHKPFDEGYRDALRADLDIV